MIATIGDRDRVVYDGHILRSVQLIELAIHKSKEISVFIKNLNNKINKINSENKINIS